MELLEKIISAFGPSGREDEVREVIKNEIEPYVDEITVDNMGNLICHKKGNGKKLMMAAHMDEIGIMVTHIDKNGFVRFAPVGGVYPYNCIHRAVRFENGTMGVISGEGKTPMRDWNLDKMYVDIGAESYEEAAKLVTIGDMAAFCGEFAVMGKKVTGKTMDDRIACYALIEAVKKVKDCPNDFYAVFTTQEELGLRGARVAAQVIEPDMAIAVDVSSVGDTPESSIIDLTLGKGPSIKIRDASYIISPLARDFMTKCANEAGIPYQLEAASFGGTDTGAVMLTGTGVPAATTSIPCRYIHSPQETVHMDDVENEIKFIKKMIETEV
ncbi:MAG: M42 family metallopeptidase [Clostridia bacterium]|nr:M42 family metallopeptidase [Clostridia bacterium]